MGRPDAHRARVEVKGGAPRRLAALRPLGGRACGLGAVPAAGGPGRPSPIARARDLTLLPPNSVPAASAFRRAE
ncbi:hypothetical protein GCM10010517_49710 [Streptosporangium fragile]|uniref:Uncharacterized protein n=1 Tax=Streptosporangium fragile TaxID=46186 RepID=A0ABN3W2R0_9ACTN